MAGIEIKSSGDAVEKSEKLSAEVGPALYKGLLKGALKLGRMIAENVEDFKTTVGTRRLSRSFLTPEPDSAGTMILGRESPVYAAIHEFGGTIEPVPGRVGKNGRPASLRWETGGEVFYAQKVHIKEKRYARNALDDFEAKDDMSSILAAEIHGVLS